MIDTTDPKAVELSLTYSQGKAIINSGQPRRRRGEIREDLPAGAKPTARRLLSAQSTKTPSRRRPSRVSANSKSPAALSRFSRLSYDIPISDIVIDTLVFPCATGDENYIGGPVETIEGIRLIKDELPGVKTILGVSNVSFGLPAAAREVVNSVFLYYATKAGLDLAIVNTEKLERFASIALEERRLAESLLFNTPPAEVADEHAQHDLLLNAPQDWREQSKEERAAINQFNIAAVAEHFRTTVKKVKPPKESIPLDTRLSSYIIEGSKDGLVEDLDKKRAEGAVPLDIINGPLMAGWRR